MININNTFYGYYFPDNIQDTYLFEKEDSIEIWKSFIDTKAKNFFQLKDNNIIFSNVKIIGNWRSFYDNEDILGLKNLFIKKLNWDLKDDIYFCINNENIIKTNVEIFYNNCFSFFEVYDDCPIIINSCNDINKYIYFAPLGGIFGRE